MTGTITKRARKTPEEQAKPDLDTSHTDVVEVVPASKESEEVRQVTKGVKEVELEDKPAGQKEEVPVVSGKAEEETSESVHEAEAEAKEEEEDNVPGSEDAPSSDTAVAEVIKAANVPLPDDGSSEVDENDPSLPADQKEDLIGSAAPVADVEWSLNSSDAPEEPAGKNEVKAPSADSEVLQVSV